MLGAVHDAVIMEILATYGRARYPALSRMCAFQLHAMTSDSQLRLSAGAGMVARAPSRS